MLIEVFASRTLMEFAQGITTHVYGVVKKGIRLLPGALKPVQEKQTAEPVTPQGAIPRGTVIEGGHIKYVLARINSRLLHGQVATTWTKAVKSTHIIVVSDGVTKDELWENLIEQAAPPGVKADVVPVNKMIRVARDPCLGNTKTMLLFETPQDAPRATENGVNVKELNISSMAHSAGKIAVSKVLSLGKDDARTFEELKAKGIQFDMCKISNDSKENMNNAIKKTKAGLA